MTSSRKTHRSHRRGGSSRRYRARGGYAGAYPGVYSTEGSGPLPAAADSSSYNDAGSWMLKTVGNVNTQFANAFDQNTGNSSNGAIVGLQGQVAGSRRRKYRGGLNTASTVGALQSSSFRASNTGASVGPLQSRGMISSNTASSVGPLQSAKYKGGRRRRGTRRVKGGFIDGALSEAALPLSILALQQTYKGKSLKNLTGGNINALLSQAAVPLSILALQQTYKKK